MQYAFGVLFPLTPADESVVGVTRHDAQTGIVLYCYKNNSCSCPFYLGYSPIFLKKFGK